MSKIKIKRDGDHWGLVIYWLIWAFNYCSRLKLQTMKTILIATDFSDAGRSAALYGTELARSFNAKVILFSAYQPVPLPVSEVPVVLNSADMRSTTEQQLESEKRIINRSGSVAMEIACAEGAAAAAIMTVARERQADVIVAGMKADHKGLRKMFGSVVTTLARRTIIPLVVVPEKVRYTPITTIALAIASDLEASSDRHELNVLQELGATFNSKTYVVRVAANAIEHAYASKHLPVNAINVLKSFSPIYETIEHSAVAEGLNLFVRRYGVNMLALLPHKRSGLERFFYKSITREVVFEAQVPLLILPELPDN
jgi:nucleotide-binding universal stress UspA family protein